jgi:hypothetical protein
MYTIYFSEKDDFKKMEQKKLDNYHLHKYNLILDNKKHTISFMSECEVQLSNQVNDLKQTLKDKLCNKHYIVYCCIMDYNDNIYIDLTEVFRHFFHYFDIKSSDKVPRLTAFFKYVEDIYGTLLDPNKYQLVLYMNDDDFSEYSYPIKDILDKTFGDLFIKTDNVE